MDEQIWRIGRSVTFENEGTGKGTVAVSIIVVELTLENGHERCDCKKGITSSEKPELVVYSRSEHGISTRNASKLLSYAVLYLSTKKNEQGR